MPPAEPAPLNGFGGRLPRSALPLGRGDARTDEDDVVEQGGPPLRLPEWARRPRWLPGLGDGCRAARPCSAWPRQENGPTDTAQLAGFPDLGLVASTECSSLTWPFFGISFLACRFTSRHLSLFRTVSDAHVPWMCPGISRASLAGQGYSGQSESMQLRPFAAEQ
jgi:hypothetical protein